MKLEALAEKTNAIVPLLRCPLCEQAFSMEGSHSLVCVQKHCFDLSRKGYINLAPSHDNRTEKYDASLFESRQSILGDGFFRPVMQALADSVTMHAPSGGAFTLLDAGCGEGSYTRDLASRFPRAKMIGVDLSRDAIVAAARTPSPAHWLVGNISRLPVQDHSHDFLLDVLTPADYGEFSRALHQSGFLLKVIPGNDYLSQVRACVAKELRSAHYDNARVLSHLEEHATILKRTTLHHTYPVTPAQAAHFAHMTPMTFGLSPESLKSISFSEITIHLELLLCQMMGADKP